MRTYIDAYSLFTGPLRWGILPWAPQTFKGTHEAFIFTFMCCIFTPFLYLSLSLHCLHSMSERLGRIISNAFTVTGLNLCGTFLVGRMCLNTDYIRVSGCISHIQRIQVPDKDCSKTLCYRHTNCLTSLLRCTFSLAHDPSPRSTVTIHTPFSWQSFSTTLTKRA